MKTKKNYVCSSCKATSTKWSGKCEACGKWNTLEEQVVTSEIKGALARTHNLGFAGVISSSIEKLSEISDDRTVRFSSGSTEFDLVLGGGFAQGSSSVLAGNPGAGKSTLLLQTALKLSNTMKVLYASGEESTSQIKARAVRLGITDYNEENVRLYGETDIKKIIGACESFDADFLIIDSMQACYTPELESLPGSVGQMKEVAMTVNRYIKSTGVTVIIVGHITKEEELAGPKAIEHIVDAVFMLSSTEDERYRIMRAYKNRYGAVTEVAIFEMQGNGLMDVTNPSSMFLMAHTGAPGCTITPLWEGSRPLFVEVQALVNDSTLPNPKRYAVGVDNNRLSMLVGVIGKHLEVPFADQDVYVNIVGGVKASQPSVDLSLVVSIISSYRNIIIPEETIIFGEVGLAGEVRPAMYATERVKEARKLGFKNVVMPYHNTVDNKFFDNPGVNIIPVKNLMDAMIWISTEGQRKSGLRVEVRG